MAVDSRLKRQSATCILAPFMLSGVYPSVSGINQAERSAITWMYASVSGCPECPEIPDMLFNINNGKIYQYLGGGAIMRL
jgi:hypothetical protein